MKQRWETTYQRFLKDYPTEGNKLWIDHMREIDSHMYCLKQVEGFEAEARSVCYEDTRAEDWASHNA